MLVQKSTTTTAVCVESGITDPYALRFSCSCAFAGANEMYKSDYDVHNAVFVDHLNTSGTVQVIQIGIIVRQ